jgi:DNA-binding NarL/FixJ family response regulator
MEVARMAGIRIAIVDDHTIVRDGLVRLLVQEEDFEVVGAGSDAAAALRLAADGKPDVMLLDLALPDANGLDVIAPLAVRSPGTRVLVLSMHAEPAYAAAALARGAWGLVSKAASPENLAAAIRRVASGERLPVPISLLPQEQRVLDEVARGRTNEEVAAVLGIQTKTVEGYAQRLMDKLGIHTRAGLVAYGRASREV